MSIQISFNTRVSRDLAEILSFYEKEGSCTLADEFFNQLTTKIHQVRSNPEQFPFFRQGIRRVNLDRFPYHLLYRIKPDGIRVFVLLHHNRNPAYTFRRQ